jgi:hypothetical protein
MQCNERDTAARTLSYGSIGLQQLENAKTFSSQASQLVMGVAVSMRLTKHARHLPGRQHVRRTVSVH